MKPDIKEKGRAWFQLAYDLAENEVEKDRLYWNAYDLGIKLPRPEDESIKIIVEGIYDIFKPFKNPRK